MDREQNFLRWTVRSVYYDRTRCNESEIDKLWDKESDEIKQAVYDESAQLIQALALNSQNTYTWLLLHTGEFK